MSDARYTAFDKSGKYLFFTASTDLGPAISFADHVRLSATSRREVFMQSFFATTFRRRSLRKAMKKRPAPRKT